MKKPIKDVFGFWQVKECFFSGKYELPVVYGTSKIPDDLVRFSKCHKESVTERTYEFAFEGIEQWGVVAVGALGCGNDKEDYDYFAKGFYKMLDVLDPETVLCYGKLSEELRNECVFRRINYKEYKTAIDKAHHSSVSQEEFPLE